MGFIVSQSVEDVQGRNFDSFYVRIENYQLNKVMGFISTTVSHYDTPESAKSIYQFYTTGGFAPSTPGKLDVSMSYNGEWNQWPLSYRFPLTQSITTQETVYSSSWHPEIITYIDFDEEGNETTGSREEWIETIHTGSIDVTRDYINLNIITGSVYEYAYENIKNVYGNIFGFENIIDEI